MSHNHFEAPSTAHLAELLPQYDIENLIAQGGMGAVYKGRQRTLDRDIAIKILPKELGDSEFRRAFASEAKAMARLNHPNLLGVFDFGEIEGMPYIVMEYVHGESLYGASHNQAIDPLQAIEIVRGICDGLAHAHENGIIHRDIKPSNILLTINAKPKIGDFGLAHAAESDHPGLMMGTPGYTAPEVFHNPDLAGKLADIYSVGIILHQLLTGIDPAGCMEPPSQMTGDIRLDSIWRKAVNMDPNQRYQTVESMAADLKKWAEFKTANPLLNNTRPYRPSPRRVPLTRASVGNDSSSTLKWFVIAILAGCAFFIFQHLQKRKKEIALGNEDKSGAIITPVQRPTISNRQEPVTQPQLPRVNLSERDTYEIPDNELSKPPFKDSEIVRKKIVKPDKSETQNPETDNDKDLSPGDPELLKRAVELIADARKKRDKKLADNASSLIFKLGSIIRENKTDDGPTISDFREKIVANRIPEVEDPSENPDQFTIKLKQAFDSETTIDAVYDSDLVRIRNAYVSRLTAAAGDASDADLKQRLTAQAALAKDLAPWINQISPEPKWERMKIKGMVSSDSFLGKWIEQSVGQERKWIAHSDGRLEIVDKPWLATWEITKDGTLYIKWDDKDPYEYSRKGDIWVGSSDNRKTATLTRGDW